MSTEVAHVPEDKEVVRGGIREAEEAVRTKEFLILEFTENYELTRKDIA